MTSYTRPELKLIQAALHRAIEFEDSSIDSYRTRHDRRDPRLKVIDPQYRREARASARLKRRFEILLAKTAEGLRGARCPESCPRCGSARVEQLSWTGWRCAACKKVWWVK